MLRFHSWLLAAKCFTDVPTPWDWTPFTMAAAMRPETRGSSEKYSKFRPPRGLRWVLRAGPRITSTPYSRVSFPIARPTRSTRSTSKLEARRVAIGNAVQ